MQACWPVEGFRRKIDRLFDDFSMGFWRSPFRRSLFAAEPFWRRELSWTAAPAVDVTESDKAYEVTAELPGMDEKNIEVKVVNGNLTIKGEKQEEKEEKKKDYYLHERHFGSFERSFEVTGRGRRRQDRGDFQEGRAHGDAAEEARGAEAGEKDRSQVRRLKRFLSLSGAYVITQLQHPRVTWLT